MPNTKIQQLVDQRARAIAENRTLLDRADESGGTLSAEAASEYDQRDAEIDALQDQIDRLHKQDAHDAAVQARAAEAVRAHVPAAAVAPATEERAGTFGQMPELGIRAYDLIRAGSPEYREGMLRYLRTGARPVEARAMEAGVNSEGGYYVHTQMQESIQRKREETSFIRRLAAPPIQTSSATLVQPQETTLGAAEWLAEEGAITPTDEVVGQSSWSPYRVSRMIKLSEELLQDAAFPLESYLAEAIARSIARAENTAFIAGSGSGQPEGIVTGASVGVTAASASAVTSDEILDLVYSLGSEYAANAVVITNRAMQALVRKLKDSDGQYVWARSLAAGQPDTLAGYPLYSSEAVPAIATGARTMVIVDPTIYQIVDRAPGVSVARLGELYAANYQVAFRGSARVDAKLTYSAGAKALVMG